MDPRANFLSSAADNVQGSLGSILGGFFNDSGRPYQKAGDIYDQSQQMGMYTQMPFYTTGLQSIGPYQNYLNQMSNPTQFINSIMGQYQQSPFAKFATQQAIRGANNRASAAGLIGSSPLAHEEENYAHQISQADMSDFLQNVLGVNREYGAGQRGLIQGGQSAANSILDLISSLSGSRADMAYGQAQGQQKDRSGILSGLLKLFI